MKEKTYVDRLFAGYEETPAIKDFKEEIAVNLGERVRGLIAKGLDEKQAFEQAAAELGDITAIADEVGKNKRKEAIGQMYMNARIPFTKKTAGGLTAATGLLMLAVGLALITFFSEAGDTAFYYVSVVLLTAACGFFTYFGLLQETAAHYAMGEKRALAYGCVCAAGVLAAGLATVTFLVDGFEFSAALAVKTVIILPAICVLIFLLLTEPKRQKPWLKAMIEQGIENTFAFNHEFSHDMINPMKAIRFGIMSGGLWVFSIAIFLTLGMLWAWEYAWLIFPFTLAIQVFMVAMIFEKKK
jgi:hypothetical protein